MLTLPSSLRVFAKTGPTDMRKSFEGLVGVVERELRQQVESGDLFLSSDLVQAIGRRDL